MVFICLAASLSVNCGVIQEQLPQSLSTYRKGEKCVTVALEPKIALVQ